MSSPLPASVLSSKIQQYSAFIENTLKRDLQQAQRNLEQCQQTHTEYAALRQSLLSLQSHHAAERAAHPDEPIGRMKTMINLGSEFYAKAVVPDPTRVFVDVGLGCHVELTLAEALTWIALKLPTLDAQVDARKQQAAGIQGKIKVVYEGIAELMQMAQEEKPNRQFF